MLELCSCVRLREFRESVFGSGSLIFGTVPFPTPASLSGGCVSSAETPPIPPSLYASPSDLPVPPFLRPHAAAVCLVSPFFPPTAETHAEFSKALSPPVSRRDPNHRSPSLCKADNKKVFGALHASRLPRPKHFCFLRYRRDSDVLCSRVCECCVVDGNFAKVCGVDSRRIGTAVSML